MFTDQSQHQDRPTSPDIYGIGISTGFSPPSLEARASKKLRRDSWASDLQKEGLVKSSYDPLIQDMIVPPLAGAVAPEQKRCATGFLSDRSDNNCTTVSGSTFRVPSPLLYHRRSRATFSDSSGHSERDESLGFTHTRLMSEIRSKTHQRKPKTLDDTQEGVFVAARLPLMGPSRVSGGLVEQEAKPAICSTVVGGPTKQPHPPILTTTNVYLYPQKLYQIFDYPSESILKQPSTRDLKSLWPQDQSLVFPTLTLSGQLLASKTDHMDNNFVLASTDSNGVQLADVDATPAHFLESRNRSSTQESLDRNFTVAGAVLTDQSKSTRICLPVGTAVNMASPSKRDSIPTSDTQLDSAPQSTRSIRTSKGSIADSRATVVVTKSQQINTTSIDEPLFQQPDDDLSGTVTISKDDAMSSDDEWNWANDQWQSDVTTPQSLDASQIGLCATEWV